MNEILHFASYYNFCFELIALAIRLQCKSDGRGGDSSLEGKDKFSSQKRVRSVQSHFKRAGNLSTYSTAFFPTPLRSHLTIP